MRMRKALHALCLIVAVSLLWIGSNERAFAQQGKPAIERMYVLHCGDIMLNDMGRFSPGFSGPGTLAVTCYLIKHGQDYVLFDTGLGDEVAAMSNGKPSNAGNWTVKKTLASQLAEIGLKPSDITHVVLSHSHPDHVGNLKMFPQATLVVQETEYDWAMPDGTPRFPPAMKAIKADGDRDLFGDGSVVLISTPGHSPGHQCLLVKLPQTGGVLLTGDSVHTKANWELKRAPRQNFSYSQSIGSLQRMAAVLKTNNAEIWIGHEPTEVARRKYAPAYYE
ncbi:MAG: N-acyl homoserine lactone hydrolase [Sphingomonadales bacterium]|nr:N-acyl homoserine lactone hydrolase [Sphingomonadales bacterium]